MAPTSTVAGQGMARSSLGSVLRHSADRDGFVHPEPRRDQHDRTERMHRNGPRQTGRRERAAQQDIARADEWTDRHLQAEPVAPTLVAEVIAHERVADREDPASPTLRSRGSRRWPEGLSNSIGSVPNAVNATSESSSTGRRPNDRPARRAARRTTRRTATASSGSWERASRDAGGREMLDERRQHGDQCGDRHCGQRTEREQRDTCRVPAPARCHVRYSCAGSACGGTAATPRATISMPRLRARLSEQVRCARKTTGSDPSENTLNSAIHTSGVITAAAVQARDHALQQPLRIGRDAYRQQAYERRSGNKSMVVSTMQTTISALPCPNANPM